MTKLGAVRNEASDQGAGTHVAGVARAVAVAATADERLTAILARLKAGIAALHHNAGQYEVRTIAETKRAGGVPAAGTPAANAPAAQDIADAGAAHDIEDLLASIGW